MNRELKDKRREWVAILDFGSQYTQLIARRVRESKVYSEVLSHKISHKDLLRDMPKAIILSGGPATVTSIESPTCEKEIFELGIPVLGICYGMQLIARVLGGEVEATINREYGRSRLIVDKGCDLFSGLARNLIVWMSHGDRVLKVPDGFSVLAHTANSPIAAMEDKKKRLYGVQFHPEVIHTPHGQKILDNFLHRIAGCSGTWTISSFIEDSIEEIRKKVGEERVICALSGGVDSSVLSVLLQKAIGERLTCIFVDNGLLRKGEAQEVIQRFRDSYHINLIYVDAKESFLCMLKGVTDPEEKRRIIGREFIRIFEDQTKKLGKVRFLAQGTLYPDVIESRSPFGGPSATIKTHHNVGGLPEEMGFELIEPFRFLFKDEVREVGKELGLPQDVVWRQPFPGPGLAVRIIGEITEERLNMLREADVIIQKEIEKSGFYKKIWQSFAILLTVKTVGVMGDERTYENVIAIRAVTSRDGMTADWAKLPYSLIGRISNRIINEVKGVNRVVYDVSSKPPGTIEWE
ncbi:MAG: glutamine-hydrolyzing GMP synthase [bacterium]|nr:glutamine-hydrolyzing GMP synthase [bacterium]